AAAREKWPGDIDTAFKYLLDQTGVDKARLGAGGASCGVNNSVQFARRHPEVKTLVLLSGNTNEEGRTFLQTSAGLPLFVSASEDDGDTLPYMRWLMAFSRNPQNKLVPFKAAGHGTNMFAVEKGLEPMILEWFDKTLRQAPAAYSAKTMSKPSPIAEFWDVLTQPGGAAPARKLFEETKKKEPSAFLFQESTVNWLGYDRLQKGDAKAWRASSANFGTNDAGAVFSDTGPEGARRAQLQTAGLAPVAGSTKRLNVLAEA